MTNYIKAKVRPGKTVRYNGTDPESKDRALDIIYQAGDVIEIREEDVAGFSKNFVNFNYEAEDRVAELMKEEGIVPEPEPDPETVPPTRGTKVPKGAKKVR